MNEHVDENITDIKELLEPLLMEKNLQLFDLEIKGQGSKKLLRIYIDKEQGVSIDDCVSVSRELGVLLDVHDLITDSYTLEVSSPGLTRPLRGPVDYMKHIGKKVKIKTVSKVEDKNQFIGSLVDYKDETVHLEMDGVMYLIPFGLIEKANLELDF